MAVAVVDLGEEDRFVGAGGVLEGEELHGVAVFGKHGLAGDQPADGGDLFPHVAAEVPGGDMVSALQDIAVEVEGVDREEETQGLGFVFEHDVWGVWGLWVYPPPPTPPIIEKAR